MDFRPAGPDCVGKEPAEKMNRASALKLPVAGRLEDRIAWNDNL